jgi:hypothetical protein
VDQYLQAELLPATAQGGSPLRLKRSWWCLHEGFFRHPSEVKCLLDRQPLASLSGLGNIVSRKCCSSLLKELPPRRRVGVNIDNALLTRVDLGSGDNLYGRSRSMLDRLGGRMSESPTPRTIATSV